jgi:hypothetical protein
MRRPAARPEIIQFFKWVAIGFAVFMVATLAADAATNTTTTSISHRPSVVETGRPAVTH